jgi:methyl-accepting chemotaxis protein
LVGDAATELLSDMLAGSGASARLLDDIARARAASKGALADRGGGGSADGRDDPAQRALWLKRQTPPSSRPKRRPSELDSIVAVFTVAGEAQSMRETVSTRKPAKPAVAMKAAAQRYLSRGNAAIKADDWAEF